MLKNLFPFMAISTLLLAGCASAAPAPTNAPTESPLPAPANTSAPENGWTMIRMTQSGGFAGVSRSIEISPDGKFMASDKRGKKTANGELSANDLSALKDLVASIHLVPVKTPEQTGCADCFVYEVVVEGGETPVYIQLNDVTLDESGFAPLVAYLRNLIETALK